MSETQNTAVDPRQFNDDELVKRIADGKAQVRELKAVHRRERQVLADEVVKPYRDEREARHVEMLAAAQGSPLPPPGN